MARTILIYGAVLAAGAFILEWLDYHRLAQRHAGEIYLGAIALGFTGLGVWLGARLFRRPAPSAGFERNAKAQASLGISGREFEVLELLAAGRSNKEIAAALTLSPNTVKTHIARLYEKLDARRRTEAVSRARELGMLP
jgi:DNA-binding CsgD family transcriptional regulator